MYKQLLEEEFKLFPDIANPKYLRKRTKLTEFKGFSKLVMLDRYSLRDNTQKTLKVGDTVVVVIKEDKDYPIMGYGKVANIDEFNNVKVDIEFPEYVEGVDLDNIYRFKDDVVKPLELYWEQICYRNARGIASVEKSRGLRRYWFKKFFWMLKNKLAIPGGRILYGAGSSSEVTLYNCFQGDTIVQTKEGAKRIKDLKGEVEVLSDGGVYRNAIFDSYGEQELYEIELDNGVKFRATAGHEWIVKEEKERVNTLNLEGYSIPYVEKGKEKPLFFY